jgi:hypothetical protein
MSSLTLKISFFPELQLFFLDPWPSFVGFGGGTLPQTNLGIPKFPTLSWQVQGYLIKNP